MSLHAILITVITVYDDLLQLTLYRDKNFVPAFAAAYICTMEFCGIKLYATIYTFAMLICSIRSHKCHQFIETYELFDVENAGIQPLEFPLIYVK